MTVTPFSSDYSGEFGLGGATTGHTGWPVLADVKNWLRLGTAVTADDAVVTDALNAAISWVTNRCEPRWLPPASSLLPYDLFQVTVMEAGRTYRRRDSVDGTVGWGDMGVVRVGPKDPDIESKITPYLNVVVG